MPKTWDAIVVGAGLAGLSAARELANGGADVLVLEGRARLGGRAWTGKFEDHAVELGGAYVHPRQETIWSEIQRYGLETEPTSTPERGMWFAAGKLHEGPADEFFAIVAEGTDRFCHDARDAVPQPFEPLATELAQELDALSVQDRLEEMEDPVQRDVMEALWSSLGSGPAREVGLLPTALQAYALAGWSSALMFEVNGGFRLIAGTGGLVEALGGDLGSSETRRETRATGVTREGGRVLVTLLDGTQVVAATCVAAVPVNALRDITFTPDLSSGRNRVLAEGILGRGVKLWARLRGEIPSFLATAPGDHPISFLESDAYVDGDTRVVGFGPSAKDLDVHDRKAVEEAIRLLIPGAEVAASGGHDWTHDPFSQTTWGSFRPGQMTRSLADLQRPEGEVFFAGGDIATGWAGYLDGAIESGIAAGRDALALLGR